MSGFDGNWIEMPGQGPIEDDAIEAALRGAPREEVGELALVVSSVRNAAEVPPAPSAAMAAVLAVGFSTEKGDLPATAASNVHGPAQQVSGLPKWRKTKMKIQGFIAGLGIAGKIALGVGVAAAATTGAGATGMLPFSLSGPTHTTRPGGEQTAPVPVPSMPAPPAGSAAGHDAQPAPRSSAGDSTTNHQGPTASPVAAPAGTATPPPPAPREPTPTPPAPPTTVVQPAPVEPARSPEPSPTTTAPTPTTTKPTTEPTPTTAPTTTPTTAVPAASETITLSCVITGPSQVTCKWSSAANPVASYQLWRWSSASDYAPITGGLTDTFTFIDNTPNPGTTYTYRVFTKRSDGSSGDFSNRAQIACCS